MKKTHFLVTALCATLLCACEKEADYSTPIDGDGNVYVVAEHYKAGKDVPYHAEKIEQISQFLKDNFI